MTSAIKTAHWPTGPVFVCERHCDALVRIGAAMGMQVPVTHAVPEGATCANCENETKKKEPS